MAKNLVLNGFSWSTSLQVTWKFRLNRPLLHGSDNLIILNTKSVINQHVSEILIQPGFLSGQI